MLYYTVTTSATDTSGNILDGSSQAVSATGSQAVSITGLSASTVYYIHFLQRDAAGNDSNVVNSASFTTADAAPTPDPDPGPSPDTGTLTKAQKLAGFANSITLTSPNGTQYTLGVSNGGVLTATED